jgi:hypothetical protein
MLCHVLSTKVPLPVREPGPLCRSPGLPVVALEDLDEQQDLEEYLTRAASSRMTIFYSARPGLAAAVEAVRAKAVTVLMRALYILCPRE